VKRASQIIVDQPPEIGVRGEELLGLPEGQGLTRAWLLWSRRRLLWRFTLWGLVAATVIAFILPKRYQSVARLMPPENQSGSGLAMLAALAGKGTANLGMQAADMLGMKNTGALFVGILSSDTLQGRLVDRYDLRRVYGVHYGQDARKILAGNSDIGEDRQSGILTIRVTDRDPQRAAQLGQGYVEELNRLLAEVSTSAARRERIFIEQRLKSVKTELDDAAQQFSQYSSKNAMLDVTSQSKAMVEAAATLQGQLIAAQSELEGLEQIYTPNNVRVRSLRARIGELKRQVEKLGGDSSTPSTDGASVGELSPSIRQLPLLGVRWTELYRRAKIEETVFELLTQQFEMAKIQEAKEIPSAKVLDTAAIPEKKSSPMRLLIMVMGAFLSFSIGCAWILSSAAWQRIAPHDPRKQFAEEIRSDIRLSLSRSMGRLRKHWADWRRNSQNASQP
jgi:uncharacterized protein involved in exopolysaccharide biosynthesis